MSEEIDYDILGTAVTDFLVNGVDEDIVVKSHFGATEMYPVHYFFRSYNDLPAIERKALRMCEGRVLDVGAGAGVHSLILQNAGFDVTAIDRSSGCVSAMRKLGVNKVRKSDFFEMEAKERFDSIILLMNGIGITGTLARLHDFFKKAYSLLYPSGQILLDSSDITYMYEEDDGSVRTDLSKNYFGEVTYKMMYKNIQGPYFNWLYVTFEDLLSVAHENGFNAEKISEGSNGTYLAKCTIKS